MEQSINPKLKAELLSSFFRPAVTTWNRLEGRPRTEDFERSLRAEIRDPIWMLCRQWQFGEFKAIDAGSAIKAKVQVNTAHLSQYAGQSMQLVNYDDSLPLETRVEREAVSFDLMTRAQMGQHWFKLLKGIGDFEAIYLHKYGFMEPNENSEADAQLRSNRKSWQTFELLKGRVIDGEALYKDIHFDGDKHKQWLTSVIPDTNVRLEILRIAGVFENWFKRVYSQPDNAEDTAWSDSYLEYRFSCAAPADKEENKQTILVGEQYYHGHLDWYSVNIDNTPSAKLSNRRDEGTSEIDVAEKGVFVEEKPISFIPNPIEFTGMPNIRWWEFEDRRTNFGNINPATSDLATLILAEFGLVYGNDWSLVPYVLEVGTLSEVQGVVITDVFGVRTMIRSATNSADNERSSWGMYYLDSTESNRIDARLFLPPTVGKIQESPPLEKVFLVRDEMANMVWGIEDIIPGNTKGGTSGFEAATELQNYISAQTSPLEDSELIDTDATIEYKLETQVPENWIPFIPVHNPGSNREIRLQRAAIPRSDPETFNNKIEPRGNILRSGLDKKTPLPYFIHNEEVLKTGTQITRSYQRTRWWDGQIHTWVGRRKLTGKVQGNSGLEFDRIIPINEEN